MELVEDEIYWTCANTVECGYFEGLREPHQVKIRVGRNGCYYGHGFDETTGEIDLDMNATIVATRSNCFKSKKEANDCYVEYLAYAVSDAQERLIRFEESRQD
jgi:hypothetical protein